MTTIARGLAEWALNLDVAKVPEPVRRAALRHVLDGLGCAVGAVRGGAAEPAVRTARALGIGNPEALIIGGSDRVSGPAAAFANGVLIHALDFDDTHALGLVHASAPVLPVALAECERLRLGGEDLLAAVIVGLETICRLGAAVPHAFHARGLHATAVCGVFAAALASARLRGLSVEQTVNALGIAGSRAGGLLEFLNTGSSTKQLHPGFAAHDGMLAAALAGAGMTGPETVFEGQYGMYRTLADREVAPDAVLDGLGTRWEATRITIKPYPACQLMHAQLDAARQLAGRAGEFEEIVAQAHPDAAAIVCGPGKERPRSAYDAKFSLPWSVAAMIVDGEVTARTYDRIDRPEVLALAARIRTEVVPFEGVAADQPGRLSARLAGGDEITAEVPRSGGGPDDPDIETTVRSKALANLGLGAEPIADLVFALPTLTSLDPLLNTLENHVL